MILLPWGICAQSRTELLDKAGACHNRYDFDKAISIYNSVLQEVSDSLERDSIIERLVRSENGRNLLEYTAEPEVLTSITVPLSTFYLYYSHLGDRKWIRMPNAFTDDEGNAFSNALYFGDSDELYFSAPDESSSRSIFVSRRSADDKWSAPTLVDEELTSTEDEVYPLVSHDGKNLFFSSRGLCGIGGYDLFVCHRDDKTGEWGAPQNLGLPYSSPYDDLLFSNTPDGNFSLFASNRSCTRDSITIYVLAYENSPIRKPVRSLDEIRRIAALEPSISEHPAETGTENNGIRERNLAASDSLYGRYISLITKRRNLSTSLDSVQKVLEDGRLRYASASEQQKNELLAGLQGAEEESMDLQVRINDMSTDIQNMSMEFLMKGVIINLEDLSEHRETMPAVDKRPEYHFEKMEYGNLGSVEVMEPEVRIDVAFKIEDEPVLIKYDEIPDELKNRISQGIVYQIRLFTSSSRASLKQLKGVSPVFETRQSSGKYSYSAGLFRTYSEVLSKLNTVKKRGFKDAFITAVHNGKTIGKEKARQIESSKEQEQMYRVVLKGYPDGLPADIVKLIGDNCSKDIIKGTSEDGIIYIIAPFPSENDARALSDILTDSGTTGVSVEPIG